MQLVYMLGAIDRIGEISDQVFYLRNLFPDAQDRLAVGTLPIQQVPRFNEAFFRIALRGLHHFEMAECPELRVYREFDLARQRPNMCGLLNRYGDGYEIEQIETRLPSGARLLPYGPVTLTVDCIERYRRGALPFKFELNDQEKAEGLLLRRGLGIPDDAPVVTLHVRDGGYLPSLDAAFRYADIKSYLPAVRHLVEEGYWVVRMGDAQMPRLDWPLEQVVDLPHHPSYRDLADPYFVSQSDFLLGTSSGPWSVARGFGVPALLTNAVFEICRWAQGGMFLPRHYRSAELGRELTYEEIAGSPVLEYSRTPEFHDRGILTEPNTAEEILRATQEMVDRVRGADSYAADRDDLNARVRAIQRRVHDQRTQMRPTLSFPFYTGYWSREELCASYIETNPNFLGHDWGLRES